MREVVEYLFGAASFVPHGYCLLWRPDLVAMHALSDVMIAASYFSIPMALTVFVRRRMDLEYKWVFWLFVAFIVACGTTHLVGLITLWQPVYGLQGLIKTATAGLSVTTAFLLWPLIPKALALPSPSALREANAELENALIAKDRALRQISALLDSAPDATIFVDRAGTIVRTNQQTERLLGYSAGELTNKPVGMLLPELCREHLFSERATGLARTEPEPFAMAKDGRKIPVEISRSPIETDSDYVVCAALRDVTERKRAEERQNLLISELDHRVKNILASVSVVARHTREESASMDEFLNALDGRIQSMARTHALLGRGRWQGVNLSDLVREELAPCAANSNTAFEGPEVVLIPDAVSPVAMVLHELVTNAGKYGALSTPQRHVTVQWSRRRNGGSSSVLVLEWKETGGPPVIVPIQPGYGSSVIRETIHYELGGTCELLFAAEGVQCKFEIPPEWINDQ